MFLLVSILLYHTFKFIAIHPAHTPQPHRTEIVDRAVYGRFCKVIAGSNIKLLKYLVRECWQEHKISRTDFRTHEDIGKYRDRSLWNSHETLINNNQPQGKKSIKNIRFCAVANCSSAYSPCASLWRIRAPLNK